MVSKSSMMTKENSPFIAPLVSWLKRLRVVPFLTALALTLNPSVDLYGQNVVDSITVTVYAAEDLNVSISPSAFSGFIGDTVTFVATVTDVVSGDTIPSIVVFGTDNPSVLEIDSFSGHSILRSRGTARISVRVERLVSLLFTRLTNVGDAVPIDTLRIEVGEVAQLCVYFIGSDGAFIGKSPALCPNEVIPFEPFDAELRQVYYVNPPALDRRGRWTIPNYGRSYYIPFNRGSDT